MAGRNKLPLSVIMGGNNSSHLTKAEIEQRRGEELPPPPAGKVEPPEHLSAEQAEKFRRLAGDLLALGILGNLDCDALARYVQSEEKYQMYDHAVDCFLQRTGSAAGLDESDLKALAKLEGLRDRAFKQCRALSADLGLSVASRCKMVAPKQEEPKKDNKFKEFLSG